MMHIETEKWASSVRARLYSMQSTIKELSSELTVDPSTVFRWLANAKPKHRDRIEKALDQMASRQALDTMKAVQEPVSDAMAGLRIVEAELAKGRRDGCETVPFTTAYGWVAVLRDLVRELSKRAELLETISTYAFDTIWICRLDGKFLFHSDSVQDLRGFTAKEANEQTLEQALSLDSSERAVAELHSALSKEQRGHTQQPKTIELECTKKGTSDTVWVQARVGFVRNERGDPIAVLGLSRDISKRKQFEHDFNEGFVDAEDAMALVDEEGQFVDVNAAFERLVGYGVQDLTTKSFSDITAPDDRERSEVMFANFAGRHAPPFYNIKKSYVSSTGVDIPCDVTVARLPQYGDDALLICRVQPLVNNK